MSAAAVTLSCAVCGAAFEARRRHAESCSAACRQRRHRGQVAPRAERLARRWGLSPGDFWRTPPWLVSAVAEDLAQRGQVLALDCCALPDDATLPRFIGPDRDGLATSWRAELAAGEAAWWNPPYSAPGPWVSKAAAEASAGVWSVGLVPASMGARWMVEAMQQAAVVEVIRGRIPFLDPNTGRETAGNRHDSALLHFRPGRGAGLAPVRYVELAELRREGLAARVRDAARATQAEAFFEPQNGALFYPRSTAPEAPGFTPGSTDHTFRTAAGDGKLTTPAPALPAAISRRLPGRGMNTTT